MSMGSTRRTHEPRIMAGVQRDMNRHTAGLYISRTAENGQVEVLIPTWRLINAGEISPEAPLLLDDHSLNILADTVEFVSGRGPDREGRLQRERRLTSEAQAECRATQDRLHLMQGQRDNLQGQVTFLRRQVLWLERELRDSHRERRGLSLEPARPARTIPEEP